MREASTQDRCARVYRGIVAELRDEVTGLTVELGYSQASPDIHRVAALDTRDHTANGILGPFTCRYQLRVTREDRRAA